MKAKALTIALTAAGLLLTGCHRVENWDNDPVGNFDALWTVLDQHYCFFREKGVDWDDVYSRYRPLVDESTTYDDLFDICADMLDELRDGHVNLSAFFNVSYYRNWWTDYPQNYNKRLVEECYLHYDFATTGALQYYALPEKVGYIRYASFSSTIGESGLDMALLAMKDCPGLIIDVRDNGGGSMTNVEILVSRFIDEPIVGGYISHKTGPGHDDFSEPYEYTYKPNTEHVRWLRPVVVLTNRSTFSAANNFVSVMKTLPNVRIVGATTGGGSGMPFSSEIPCGWGVRFSACSLLDPQGRITEFGVDPSEGCEVDLDPELALKGVDTMLEFAIDMLKPTEPTEPTEPDEAVKADK